MKPFEEKLTIKDPIPQDCLNEEARNEKEKRKEREKTVNREDLIYKTNKYIYNF